MEDPNAGGAAFAIVMFIFMFAFYGGIILMSIGSVVLWIIALVDAVKREFKDHNEKLMWVLVVCLGQFIGGIVYLVVGRKKGWLPGEGPPAGTYYPPPAPPS